MYEGKPTSIPSHRDHESYQHNTASRLEKIAKKKATHPKKKRATAAQSHPDWLLQAQAAVRGAFEHHYQLDTRHAHA